MYLIPLLAILSVWNLESSMGLPLFPSCALVPRWLASLIFLAFNGTTEVVLFPTSVLPTPPWKGNA